MGWEKDREEEQGEDPRVAIYLPRALCPLPDHLCFSIVHTFLTGHISTERLSLANRPKATWPGLVLGDVPTHQINLQLCFGTILGGW